MQLDQDPHSAATVFHTKRRNIILFGIVVSSTNGAFFAVTANGPKNGQNGQKRLKIPLRIYSPQNGHFWGGLFPALTGTCDV